jgi:ATP-dependent Clp protease, protease subunit
MAGRIYSPQDIDVWFDWGFDPKTRKMYLGSITFDSEAKEVGVDASMAEYCIKGLEILNRKNKKQRISILMNNIGGDWFHGMAIYDAIRASTAPVDIEIYGHAMSMGAVILQAGRKRLMHPNSALMVHDGYADAGNRPVQSARNWSDFEEKVSRPRMYSIFAERSGHYASFWKRKCSHDMIMTPEEAVKFGLADAVLHPKRKLPNIRRKRDERRK